MLIVFIVPLLLLSIYWYQNAMFKKTSYHQMTHYSFRSTVKDLGRYGEYLTYKMLKGYEEKGGKFLFNCYLPKDDGNTTEIDVILINEDGVFCFESKNYSGWIFGDEKSKTWTQTLPQGKGHSHKEHFLNPIIQNKVHIKWLKKQIGESIPVHSIIVFSKRCTLKKVTIESPHIYVINRPMVLSTVKKVAKGQTEKLPTQTINRLYNALYPYTQVTDMTKLQHIDAIKKKVTKESDPAIKRESPTKVVKKEYIDMVEEQDETITNNSGICPKCGSELILRTVKRGDHVGKEFYGCSSYPKCRFMSEL